MNWDSVEAFLAMGGHGWWVWGSLFAVAVCIGVETGGLCLRWRRLANMERERR